MSKKENVNTQDAGYCRLGKVGGQAVLEGVMMKAGSHTVTTCRKEDKSLVVTDNSFVSVRTKHKILDLPIIRGVVNFVEMMALSFKTLGASADAMGLEEEEPSKFEKWLQKVFGVRITDFIMLVALILGLALSVVLFIWLPAWISEGVDLLLGHLFSVSLGMFKAVLEGFVKVGIFVAYLALVSLMPDIKRTFMYHGAEHKSIACFEAGDELTPENAMKHRRFHPRCGTSFMFFMILLGIIAGLFIRIIFPDINPWAYNGIRLLILPLLMGIGYEIIRIAGKHDNVVTRTVSAPGLWVQRITTKEPTEDMLEVAIISLKCALRDDFPEFREYFESRAWETKSETTDADSEPDGTAEPENVESTDTEAPHDEAKACAPSDRESFTEGAAETAENRENEKNEAPVSRFSTENA